MPLTCTATALETAAADFEKLSDRSLVVVEVYLLATMAALLSGSVSTTAAGLESAAAAYQGLSDEALERIRVYLLCQIASVSGV